MVLPKSSKLTEYKKKLKRLLDSNLIDIIIFGSLVKGGFPKDIDIALVVKEKIDLINLKKKIRNTIDKNLDIQIIDIWSLYSPLWLTIIKEGFSIRKNKYLFEIYKIKPKILYKYSLKKLNNVQKVQFERGIKNIIKDKGAFLTRSVILIPITFKNEIEEFLKRWDIYYESQEYELLPLLRKEEFL